jgi:hypothetical protein
MYHLILRLCLVVSNWMHTDPSFPSGRLLNRNQLGDRRELLPPLGFLRALLVGCALARGDLVALLSG